MSVNTPSGVLIPLLDAKAATGASKEFTPSTTRTTFQVSGTFSGTCTIQGSLDGTNWDTVGTALTAPGFVTTDSCYKYLRANVTAYTSGSITCKAYY